MSYLEFKYFLKQMKELQTAFRSRTLNKEMLRIYFKKLSFISNDDFAKTVDKVLSEIKYFPSISEIILKYHQLPKKDNSSIESSCSDPGCVNGLTYRFNVDKKTGYYFLCSNPYCKARKRYEKARTPEGNKVWLEVPRKGNWQTDQEYWASRSTPADKEKTKAFLARCGIDPDKIFKRSTQ